MCSGDEEMVEGHRIVVFWEECLRENREILGVDKPHALNLTVGRWDMKIWKFTQLASETYIL